MRIARFTIEGRPCIAVDGGDGYVDFGAIIEAHGFRSELTGKDPERRIIRILSRGMLDETFIREELDWAKRSGNYCFLDVEGLTPLLPLRPGKIICIARNWAAHAKEGNHETPDEPFYFAKTENSAIGYGEKIPLRAEIGRVDHEGELGVVISKKASRVSNEETSSFILGYTVINDVTARALQRELAGEGRPWYLAKSMDGFAPMGPCIVLCNEAEPLKGKKIRVMVNGEIRQDGSIDDMIFKVPELIEAVSRYITLMPGDIIATGTPAGVSELYDGDEVAVEIDGIGRLVNPVEKID